MRKLRAGLWTALLLVIVVYGLWIVIQPFIPFIIVALVMVMILGAVWHRSTRW